MENCYNSHLYEYERFCATKPKLAYDASQCFSDWQKSAREKLSELLGLPLEKCDSELKIEYTKEKEDHTEYRFVVQTEPGYYVPCHLLIPAGKTDKIPLTICLSGHGPGMHIVLGVAKTEKDQKTISDWPHRATLRAHLVGPRGVRAQAPAQGHGGGPRRHAGPGRGRRAAGMRGPGYPFV